ncbi:MAG: GNAT family N-acetyltransferase [bacterium]|nr:GNAT family N-acetyltransferase [bacterium]
MNDKIRMIEVNESNISDHPPTCFLNPKNEGFRIKLEWLRKRFAEGMKIKLLYLGDEKKSTGFIEYIPGEYAWRAVDAKGYMFIHCIWINGNKNKERGFGSLLINECIKDAKEADKIGVAVITSEGSFMAGRSLFLKNGFEQIEEIKPSLSLLLKKFKDGPLPYIKDRESQLEKYKGLNIVYSDQCPWVSRSINDLKETAKKFGLRIKVNQLKNAEEAQNAPSVYSVFNLIYDGKLLSDHYISKRRFENILKKDVLKSKKS